MPALGTQSKPVMNPTSYGLERQLDKFTFPCHPYLGRLALTSLALPSASLCTLLSVVDLL